MPVTHQPSVTIIGKFVGMAAEEAGNLGLHGMRQQRSRAVAQNLGQWVGKGPWLRQPDDIILGHGVSLLWWRSGGVEHPHDTPPYPFTPSPTSAHNSLRHCSVSARANGLAKALANSRLESTRRPRAPLSVSACSF